MFLLLHPHSPPCLLLPAASPNPLTCPNRSTAYYLSLLTTRRGRGVVHFPSLPRSRDLPHVAHAHRFWQTCSFLLAGLFSTSRLLLSFNLEKVPRFNRLSPFDNAAISSSHAQPLSPPKGFSDVLQRALRLCSSSSAHQPFRKGNRPHALRLSFPLCRCFSQISFHSSYPVLRPYLTLQYHSVFSRSFYLRHPQRQCLFPALEARFHSFVSSARHSLPR